MTVKKISANALYGCGTSGRVRSCEALPAGDSQRCLEHVTGGGAAEPRSQFDKCRYRPMMSFLPPWRLECRCDNLREDTLNAMRF